MTAGKAPRTEGSPGVHERQLDPADSLVRLPLELDAKRLADEVFALDETWWRATSAEPGTATLALVAVAGDPHDETNVGPMAATPALASSPYLRQVLANFAAPIGRTRLLRLDGNSHTTEHRDRNYYLLERLRIHVPVVVSPLVTDPPVAGPLPAGPTAELVCGQQRVRLSAGEIWACASGQIHQLRNAATSRAVHLLVDTVGSPELTVMIDAGNRPFADPPRPGAPVRHLPFRPGIETPISAEQTNYPLVMTPWELSRHCDRMRHELAATVEDNDDSSTPLERFASELDQLAMAWRTLWAQYADQPTGFGAFRGVVAETTRRSERLRGQLPLRNGLDAVDALRQWILLPALNPQLALPRPSTSAAPGPEPRRQPAPANSPQRFERPVFIVCSPRSGSSLLFETLARSPDLWTVGGESHHIFETLPAFQPARRGWSSNRSTASDARPLLVERLVDGFFLALRDRDGKRPAAGAHGLRLLEKTPKNALRVPFLAAAFPDALFVYLYRNPRETIYSIMEAWRSGRFVTYPRLPGWSGPPWSLALVPGWRELVGLPLEEIAARQWQAITDQLLADMSELAPQRWCLANYGALVSQPEQEITRLCQFLGISWDQPLDGAALPHSSHTLTPPESGKWRRNAAAIERVMPLVAATAERALDLFARRPGHLPVFGEGSAGAEAANAANATDAAASRAETNQPTGGPTPPAAQPAPHHLAKGGAPPDALPRRPASTTAAKPDSPLRSVHTSSFAALLAKLDASLVVSTYQSGKVVVVRADGQTLNTHFANYPSPMGLAFGPHYLAIGTRHHIFELRNVPTAGERVTPAARHDACFLPRRQHFTGDLQIHELAFAGEELWAVNTRFSCLVTFDRDHSFVPRWQPPFISALAPEDRCHLNGLCIVDGAPRYVTALATSDVAAGWRETKAVGGVLVDVASREIVVRGLAMPHSPRFHRGQLWLLESGKGELGRVDMAGGKVEPVIRLPGFTRGLAFAGRYAFVGLSQVRESVFAGLPVSALEERSCGVWVVDLETGSIAAFLRFEDAVQEIFDVQLLPGLRYPHVSDPSGELLKTTYVLPSPAVTVPDLAGQLLHQAAPPE